MRELGPEYAIPAGCRGSGSPADLAWLAEACDGRPATRRVVDVGAGIGGPAAWLAEHFGAAPVCVEPMRGAAAAGRRLFGLPTVVADAQALPLATGAFDLALCLGVLCTVPAPDRPRMVRELRRVLRPGGDLGLLVFVARGPLPGPLPDGNDFPTEDALCALLDGAGFRCVQTHGVRRPGGGAARLAGAGGRGRRLARASTTATTRGGSRRRSRPGGSPG